MDKNVIVERAKDYTARERDSGFRAEVERLLEDSSRGGERGRAALEELEDRFYRNLEFGTGGLRGLIGGGYNRMNTLVVKSATQGLATYLIKTFPHKARTGALSAALAYDSRHYSAEFAEAAALIFAANGISAYLFSGMRPTPELSFAIRSLGCDTGAVVTASHNPPRYNGYKAYWNDGSQVIPPHDAGIIEEVNRVTTINEMDREEALDKGLLRIIDREVDEPYQAMVKAALFRPQLIRDRAAEVTIVYTPLHGTGAMHVEKVLGDLGLRVITVPEQREGNGDFPTVEFPNPEEAPALKMAIDLGKAEKADVIMATDPDADRFGIAVPSGGKPKGEEYTLITGNQMGVLLADYIFLSLKELGKFPANAAMVNSIVTTGMQARVAASYGAECLECLTGFKWIADLMRRCDTGELRKRIVFGTEESYGYLVENEVRDKDGISAAALTAEMTLYWRAQGKSLLERLEELYIRDGYWQEFGLSKYFEGPEGPAIMAGIMEDYRNKPPAVLGGIAVEKVRDIKAGQWLYPQAGGGARKGEPGKGEPRKGEPFNLPPSDVLQFYLNDGTVVSARPSGTEPKIKFYATCRAPVGAGGLPAAREEAARKLEAISRDIRAVIDR